MNLIDYLNQIDSLDFFPLRDNLEIWIDLQEEGIFEEYEEGNFLDNWVYGYLKLKDEDQNNLKNMDTDAVEFFNELDIKIKEKYNLKIIDFINYQTGQIVLLKYLK